MLPKNSYYSHTQKKHPHPPTPPLGLEICLSAPLSYSGHLFASVPQGDNNNNILYSSQREIKAVVRSHNEEHLSIILSHETHAHTHS